MASFSLKEELTILRNQFPLLFPVGSGIRSHFPTGKTTSISALRHFVFRRGPINLSAGGVSSSTTFQANGAGGWLLSVDVTEGFEVFNQKWTVAFVFTHSDTNAGHGQSISGDLGGFGGGQVDHKSKQSPEGGDPWIQQNWPDAFAGDIKASFVDSDEDVFGILLALGLAAGFTTFALLAAAG
jgi:hypothetical protein